MKQLAEITQGYLDNPIPMVKQMDDDHREERQTQPFMQGNSGYSWFGKD